jgi:hypothetical protein
MVGLFSTNNAHDMKQMNLFGGEINGLPTDQKYHTGIEAPIYEPKNKKPHLLELADESKTKRLIKRINESGVSQEEKAFLTIAAMRHTVFHYEKIADYYAHASAEMQNLMEQSGLVIVDFEDAIANGFVKLCEDIRRQYLDEYGE